MLLKFEFTLWNSVVMTTIINISCDVSEKQKFTSFTKWQISEKGGNLKRSYGK